MPRVLIAGCGYLGEALADRLHAAGWNVMGWTASPESAERLAAAKPYPVTARDIAQPLVNWDIAGISVDAVVDCVSSGKGGADVYRRVYLDGARHLLAAFPRARFVFTSSTSVYAQTDGSWVDEKSPAQPDRETGQVLRETEELVLGAGGTVARVAGIYGPGRSVLLRKFLSGEAVIEDAGSRWLNQAHRDDIVSALVCLLAGEIPSGIYNVVDDTPLTQAALFTGLAERLGGPLPPFGTVDANRKRGVTNKRVSNAKLRRQAGWVPKYACFFDALETLLTSTRGREEAGRATP